MPGRLEPFARRTSSTPLATAATTLIPPRTRGVSNTSGSMIDMPRHCSVCRHADRTVIESELVGGGTYRDIAGRHGLSTASVHRHRERHLPRRLARAKRMDELAHADVLLERLAALERKAKALTEKAEAGGEFRTALAGVREQGRLIELAARIETEDSLSRHEALQFAAGVTAVIRRHVTDPIVLRRIGSDVLQLSPDAT